MIARCGTCGSLERNPACGVCRSLPGHGTRIEPAPTSSVRSQSVTDAVLEDLRRRREFGVGKYGTELKSHNGRDPLVDAYQEALDLALYLKQALLERDTLKAAA